MGLVLQSEWYPLGGGFPDFFACHRMPLSEAKRPSFSVVELVLLVRISGLKTILSSLRWDTGDLPGMSGVSWAGRATLLKRGLAIWPERVFFDILAGSDSRKRMIADRR